jgi:arylsulfatase A-like enzyme
MHAIVFFIRGSSNLYPRRGGKCTLYQGGTTGDGILSGPALASRYGMAPQVYRNIFHAVDWLPTLAQMTSAKPAGKPLDGVSHLEALQIGGRSSKSTVSSPLAPPPREEVFVGYSFHTGSGWYGPAIRWKGWKLIQGSSGGPESADHVIPGTATPAKGGTTADTDYLLYNLESDPAEAHDVSDDYPVLLQILQAKLRDYQKSFVPPSENDPSCPFPGAFNSTQFGPVCLPWCSKSSEIVVYS